MVKTYDIGQVRNYTAEVNAQLDRCENGEGVECTTIDATLAFCASQCCEFTETLRKWSRDVFSGSVIFDSAAEQLWKAELHALYARSMKLYRQGEKAEKECYILSGRTKLRSALWILDQLRRSWVTPKLSVGPSARLTLDDLAIADGRKKIAELPPLPRDWKPADQQLAKFFR